MMSYELTLPEEGYPWIPEFYDEFILFCAEPIEGVTTLLLSLLLIIQ